MFRRRFRQLEVDAQAESTTEGAVDAESAPAPVFRRSLELGKESGDAFAPREERVPPLAETSANPPAQRAPHAGSAEPQRSADAGALGDVATPADARDEPGFGAVLASGALTACIFALVSIPVRAAFAASAHGVDVWRGSFELLAVVALTLALRRLFARMLATL